MLLTACSLALTPAHVSPKIKLDLQLVSPPRSLVDAMRDLCKTKHDDDVCLYAVALEKHYEKLDAL